MGRAFRVTQQIADESYLVFLMRLLSKCNGLFCGYVKEVRRQMLQHSRKEADSPTLKMTMTNADMANFLL